MVSIIGQAGRVARRHAIGVVGARAFSKSAAYGRHWQPQSVFQFRRLVRVERTGREMGTPFAGRGRTPFDRIASEAVKIGTMGRIVCGAQHQWRWIVAALDGVYAGSVGVIGSPRVVSAAHGATPCLRGTCAKPFCVKCVNLFGLKMLFAHPRS